MTSEFISLSKYKNISAFGENVYLFEDEKGIHSIFASDVLNGVEKPRHVFMAHTAYEHHFISNRISNSELLGFFQQKIPHADLDTMLNDDNYQIYYYVSNEYPFDIHLLRGDGLRVVAPFFIDQHILNERHYMLDDFLEHLLVRNNIWIPSQVSWNECLYLSMPFNPTDEEKLSGIIENFNLNQNCEGLESDRCEAFSCVIHLTQEEIAQVRDYCVRYNARTLTDEEKKHELYGVEKFIAYELLGGKHFVIPCPEEPKRRFKR